MAAKKKAAKVDISEVRVECFMLCNFAQVEAGKLNIIGGGWTELIVPEFPVQFGFFLAIKVAIPVAHKELFGQLRIRLVEDEKGDEIDDRPIDLNVSELDIVDPEIRSVAFASAVLMQLEIARPGRFHSQLWIADQMITRSGFAVRGQETGRISADEAHETID